MLRDEVGVAVERGAGGQTVGVCPTIVSCPQVERDHVARRETIRGVTSGLTPRIPYEPPSTVTRHPRNLKETDRLVTLVNVYDYWYVRSSLSSSFSDIARAASCRHARGVPLMNVNKM